MPLFLPSRATIAGLSVMLGVASTSCNGSPDARHDVAEGHAKAPPETPLPAQLDLSSCDPLEPLHLPLADASLEVQAATLAPELCKVRILDIREPTELNDALGAIRGAESWEREALEAEALSWDREQPLVVVSLVGRRSLELVRTLRRLGFTRVASLAGGMLAWEALSLPAIPSTPSGSDAATDVEMRPVSYADVVAHIEDRNRVRWTKAARLMLHGTQACVDGRDDHAIIGTPGGDAGELVLALGAAELEGQRSFSAPEIEHIVDAYLEAFGHFYLHSDDEAATTLLQTLRTERPHIALPEQGDIAGIHRFLERPPASVRELLVERLVEPDHIGCGHLRLMMQHPDDYGIRRDLVADVVQAFFRRLWDGHPAPEFVILRGRHEESAVVVVELENEVHTYSKIPLVSPRVGDTEVFVTHPDVAHFVRRENAAFLREQVALLRTQGLREEAFLATLEDLAQHQLEATLRHLAFDLPLYRVRFHGETFDVLLPTPSPAHVSPPPKRASGEGATDNSTPAARHASREDVLPRLAEP